MWACAHAIAHLLEETFDNIQKQYKTLQLKGHLLPTRKKNFKVHEMIANSKKTLNVAFLGGLPTSTFCPSVYLFVYSFLTISQEQYIM